MKSFWVLFFCIAKREPIEDMAIHIEKEEKQEEATSYQVSNEAVINLVEKAQKGHAESQYQLALIKLKGEGGAFAEGYSWLEKAAKQSYVPASVLFENLKSLIDSNMLMQLFFYFLLFLLRKKGLWNLLHRDLRMIK